MLKHLITPVKPRPPSGPVRLVGPVAIHAASARNTVGARSIDHRNGAGHLDPEYEAALRGRVHHRAQISGERAFLSGTSTNTIAQECGREFVMTVTSGEDGGSAGLDEETIEDRGGLFVHIFPDDFADNTANLAQTGDPMPPG